jgi:heme exporter protein A
MADRGTTPTLAGPGSSPAPATPLAPAPAGTGASAGDIEDSAVRLDGLTRRYGEREALEDVSLSLPAGQTLVVFGPNGAGKTTLLRVLATLLRPHDGLVRVLGASLPEEAWALRGRVGLLGHEPLLYRELTARENLMFHARLHGVSAARVDEQLAAVRLADRADEPLKTLSRGMVQRAAVARATLHDPELLLLDEPRANLDPAASELVEPLIGLGDAADPSDRRTRVISSHDPDGGLREADLVLGLRDGRVALLRAAGDVDRDEIVELYR